MSERKLLVLMTAEQAETFARLVAAAEHGDGGAACRLGDMYREGQGGVRYSPKQTYRWYAKSALAGDTNGQNNLGACYEHGLGCAQSYAKAVKWYRRSVAQGVSTAYMNLGYCYLRGHGVPRDTVEALRLFRIAVEGGEERAQQEVERLEGELDSRAREPVPSDTPRARPCGLGARVRPCDGPRAQLPHPDIAVREMSEAARDQTAIDTGMSTEQHQGSTDLPRHATQFVDETQPGRHIGLVGIGGVPPPPWEDEEVRRELLEIMNTETANPDSRSDEATEDELFPIFAEGGLKPDDLVEGIAERYAEYLKQQPND